MHAQIFSSKKFYDFVDCANIDSLGMMHDCYCSIHTHNFWTGKAKWKIKKKLEKNKLLFCCWLCVCYFVYVYNGWKTLFEACLNHI